jgi:hypothetical protein
MELIINYKLILIHLISNRPFHLFIKLVFSFINWFYLVTVPMRLLTASLHYIFN